ncbi:Pentatricopeptide repeat-containing protein [Platanthera zijinensis]|uniref:Pentatricopeptide repeat-containing protein n=1 Tax=Platanthera zijinensis TaxID=2320716 RepID=A0AAP0FV75_9ASPA
MRFHAAISPAPSPPHLFRLSNPGVSLGSGVRLAPCFFSPNLIAERRRDSGAGLVRCSISQVHNYGTVDYERRSASKWSTLYRRISMLENPNAGCSTVIEQWENEERELSKWDLCRVIKELRKYGRFKRALEDTWDIVKAGPQPDGKTKDGEAAKYTKVELKRDALALHLIQQGIAPTIYPRIMGSKTAREAWEWLENEYKGPRKVYDWIQSRGDRFTFNSGDDAIQLDLIAKVQGISHAEEYFSNLPRISKDRRTYGALLNVYGQAKMREKAESTLELMKAKGCAYDVLPFNVMMTLYMNINDHNKVLSMINEMKEKNVPFDLYSYNIWITNCATMGDVSEMERVVQEMIADTRVNANWTTYTTLATMYIRLCNFDKAHNCLTEAEQRMTGRDSAPFNYLLGLYSSIGKRDEVYRIWGRYKSSFPSILNMGYQSMLSSLVKLGDAEGAEKIFKEWLSKTLKLDPRICNIVMRYYLREGLVGHARKILDSFREKGGMPKPLSWEILAEGYLKEKQISEVLSCLEVAASYKGLRSWSPKPGDVAKIVAVCREQDDKESARLLIDILRRTGCLEKEEYRSLIAK